MKVMKIKPEKCFANGERVIATQFSVESRFDNLFDRVDFLYRLFDENGVQCGEAMVTLNGLEEYRQWDTSAEGAYRIVARLVNMEIVEPEAAAEGEEVKTVFVEVG